MSENMPDRLSLEAGYETTDVRSKPLVLSALALAVAVGLVCIFLIWFSGLLEGRAERHDPQLSPLIANQSPPPPRLQEKPANDLARLRAAEDRALNGYRWIDKEPGVVQLPVERAIELLLEEGLPETKDEVPRVLPEEKEAAADERREEER
ncbi:MAG TPA: hypothetical protein VFI31_14065 [Pirellulales bacterium]|nr:hypothetical protein [Pirellulales bacterium]